MLCAFVVINIVQCLLYTRARFLVLYNFVSCELTCLLYRMQGYRVVAGTLESEESYYKRISGIIRLYAAIIQYPVPKDMVSASVSMGPFLYICFLFQPHPHGPEHGWAWLANILNAEPRSGITATALLHFLEVRLLTGSIPDLIRDRPSGCWTQANGMLWSTVYKIVASPWQHLHAHVSTLMLTQ